MIILEEWGHSVSDIFQILSKKERKRVGSQGRGQWKGYALFLKKKKTFSCSSFKICESYTTRILSVRLFPSIFRFYLIFYPARCMDYLINETRL
jgi:hypothetical protein